MLEFKVDDSSVLIVTISKSETIFQILEILVRFPSHSHALLIHRHVRLRINRYFNCNTVIPGKYQRVTLLFLVLIVIWKAFGVEAVMRDGWVNEFGALWLKGLSILSGLFVFISGLATLVLDEF